MLMKRIVKQMCTVMVGVLAACLLMNAQAAALAATTTTLRASPSPGVVGQQIALTATVTGASPTGTITFKSGKTTLGTAALSGGVATLNTSFAAPGTYSLTAVYGGDTKNK